MSNKPLTAAACRKFVPGRTRRRIRDTGARSLFLIVEHSGHKSWQMRFRTPTGRIGKLTLGPLDLSGKELASAPEIGQPLTLAAARQLAAEVHRQRALGRDPVADHKAKKRRQRVQLKETAANTFAAAARRYIEEHARPETRRWREVARLLGLHYGDNTKPEIVEGALVERWADKPVASIDDHDIYTVLEEARRVGVPGIEARNKGLSEARARALFTALSSLFSWLHKKRRVAGNPCVGLRPKTPEARDRILSNSEIVWFWKAADTEPFGALLKVLLLTGARLNEVAGMRHSELAEDGTWNLPGSRTKNGRPHKVPLPPLARDLIHSIPRLAGSDFVFTTTGVTPVSGWSRLKRRLDKNMLAIARKDRRDAVIPEWRLHDLRRTAVSGMAELGIRPDLIELIVNHVSGSRAGVAGTYNRSELLPERKAALERWALHVSGEPAKVVRLPRRRSGK